MSLTESSGKSLWLRLVERFGEYTIVGVGTFLVDLALLASFIYLLSINEPLAIGVAFFISVHLNYFILQRWVYKGSKEAPPRTYFYFILLATAMTFAIPALVIWAQDISGWNILLLRMLVGGAIGIFGFCFNTFFNFRLL